MKSNNQPTEAPFTTSTGPRASSLIAIGAGTFIVGAAMAFGYTQWQAQQTQLALMTEMVAQMNGRQDVATRNASLDLTAITPEAAPQTAEVVPVSAPTPTPEAQAPETQAPVTQATPTTAERLRSLTQSTEDAVVATEIAQDVTRREVMSQAIAGVKVLANGVVNGSYEVNVEDTANGTRLSLNISGLEVETAALEELLSKAASAGDIALHNSVTTSDGSVDPQTLVFDVVHRALANGNGQERIAAAQMRQRATSMSFAVTETVGDQRFYVVEGGDSLAYIALQFYGATDSFEIIFQANRETLSSPDKIQIGQRLLIPSV